MAGREDLYGLIIAMANKDLLGAFNIVERVLASGIDCRLFAGELGEIFRNIMLAKISHDFVGQLVQTEQDLISKVSDKFTIVGLASMLSTFEDAERAFGINMNSRWVLEAAVVKIMDKNK